MAFCKSLSVYLPGRPGTEIEIGVEVKTLARAEV